MRVNNPTDGEMWEFNEQVRDAHAKGRFHFICAVPVRDGYMATDDVFALPYRHGERDYVSIQDAERDLGKYSVVIHWQLRDPSQTPVNHFTPN